MLERPTMVVFLLMKGKYCISIMTFGGKINKSNFINLIEKRIKQLGISIQSLMN